MHIQCQVVINGRSVSETKQFQVEAYRILFAPTAIVCMRRRGKAFKLPVKAFIGISGGIRSVLCLRLFVAVRIHNAHFTPG